MPALAPDQGDVRIAVLGAGSWGTALAALAARRYATLLWARRPDAARALITQRENTRYLPGVTLPEALTYTSDLAEVWQHLASARHALIILGVPVAGLFDACRALHDGLIRHPAASLVWTCKGLNADTAQLPHEIVAQALPSTTATGVLSGPSFAVEVARGLPVALTIASGPDALRRLVAQVLHGERVRIYSSDDVIGVETGGALKNVMALACGICDGLQLGENARAALVTRGLAEMTRFGVALGQGRALPDILADGITAEGARCAQAVLTRACALNVDMPITAAVCDVLFHGKSPAGMAEALLAREARAERF